jgi:hypothetical protein
MIHYRVFIFTINFIIIFLGVSSIKPWGIMNYFFHDATQTGIKKKSGVEDPKRLFAVVIDNEDNDNRNERDNERNDNINERNNNINNELSELKKDHNELKKFLKHYVVNVNLLEKPEKSKSK